MADQHLTELDALSVVDPDAKVYVVQGGVAYQAEVQALRVSGWALIDTWQHAVSGSSATVDFTGLDDANDILIICRSITQSVSGQLALRLSVNGGSSYYSTSGDYVAVAADGTETNSTAAGTFHNTGATAARSGAIAIRGANISGAPKYVECITSGGNVNRLFVVSTLAINAVRIYSTGGGNLTAGTIYCFARIG